MKRNLHPSPVKAQGPTQTPGLWPRRACRVLVVLAVLGVALAPGTGASAWKVKIRGAVCRTLEAAPVELSSLDQASLKLNDLTTSGRFRGCFWCSGPTLRGVIELAGVCAAGSKQVALAVVIRAAGGRAVALSWGEVFYRQPGMAILATSSSPVMPHTSCERCHEPQTYLKWLRPLRRKVLMPRLVLGSDRRSDRCLEGVQEIELVHLGMARARVQRLFSPRILLQAGHRRVEIAHLGGMRRISFKAGVFGEGRGFHGTHAFRGVALVELIRRRGIRPGMEDVVVVSAPDGYTAVFSWGELALDEAGARVILAEEVDGRPIGEGGRFWLIAPGDLWADRWVKAVSCIRVLNLGKEGRE